MSVARQLAYALPVQNFKLMDQILFFMVTYGDETSDCYIEDKYKFIL